jgi:arabinogalactan endo-1,4-beta-galactosidase
MNPLINSACELDLNGWSTTGRMEPGSRSGKLRLTHGPGQHETTQTLLNLPDGWYTLRARVCSSGGQSEAYISLKDCGGAEQRTSVPLVKEEKWLQIVVSAEVTNRQCTICLYSAAPGGDWVSFADIEFAAGRAALPVMGADISSLIKSEAMGGVYAGESGVYGDALSILRAHGLNYARIRVWVNSPDGYHGLGQLLEIAKRLKEQKIKLLVDFHYSDSWADPAQQYKPAAWETPDFDALKQALYAHTRKVCSSLVAQGTPPAMVQVGNEINHGMLWPDGKNESDWSNLAALLKEGYRAVKDCSPSTLVMLHIAEGGNNEQSRWWFDHAVEHEAPFDVIGISYYPYWHGSLADLQNNLNDIAVRYNKDIYVVETAYPFTPDSKDSTENVITCQTAPGYPFTPEGQMRMLADVMSMARAVPNGRCLGVFWWDATWTAVPGNGWDPRNPALGNNWENQALFDFNNRALPAMNLFNGP